VKPYRVIGRSFRTGELAVNITDSVQLRAMSYYPFFWNDKVKTGQFVGVGVCCHEAWCHPDCLQYQQDELVLVC
jgi:hypothetical protein